MWTSGYLDPRLSSLLSKYGEKRSPSPFPAVHDAESTRAPSSSTNSGDAGSPLSPRTRESEQGKKQTARPETGRHPPGRAPFRILILFGSSGGTSAAIAFSLFHSLRQQLSSGDGACTPRSGSVSRGNHGREGSSQEREKNSQPITICRTGDGDSHPEKEERERSDAEPLRDAAVSSSSSASVFSLSKKKERKIATSASGGFSEGSRAAETALEKARNFMNEARNASPSSFDPSSRKLWFLDRACAGGVELLVQSMEFFSFDDLVALLEESPSVHDASSNASSPQTRPSPGASAPCPCPAVASSSRSDASEASASSLSASSLSSPSSSSARLLLLFCLSTASQGTPPSAAAAFCADAEDARKDFRIGKNILSTCLVAGIGCGSTEYPASTFCRPAKHLFKTLTGHLEALPLLLLPCSSDVPSPLSASSLASSASAPPRVSAATASSLLLLSDTHTDRSLETKVKKWETEAVRRLVDFLRASPNEREIWMSLAKDRKSRERKTLSGGSREAGTTARRGKETSTKVEINGDPQGERVTADEQSAHGATGRDAKGESETEGEASSVDAFSSAVSSGEESDLDETSSIFSSEDDEAEGRTERLATSVSGTDTGGGPCGNAEGNHDLEDVVGAGEDNARSGDRRRQRERETQSLRSCVGGDGEAAGEARRRRKTMLSEKQATQLKKEGYKLVGSHSAVKLCRWTKSQLRGRGGCYKHTFYGITSSQCMELTPSLACANKCVFCWRHHKNPVGTSWRWQMDSPDFVVEQGLKNHFAAVKELKGMAEVNEARLASARAEVRHCALSLVGEPIMYPRIDELVKLLHQQHISTFLVTNAQFPDALRNLPPVTQLYVSVDAANPKDLKALDQPLFADYWERFVACLELLKEKRQRTVYRLTLVAGYNMDNPSGSTPDKPDTGENPETRSTPASPPESPQNEAKDRCCRAVASGDTETGHACGCRSPSMLDGDRAREETRTRGLGRRGEKATQGRAESREGQSLTDRSAAAYAKLVLRGSPDLIEVKAVTYSGTSKHSKLTMKNIPWHDQALCDALPAGQYAIACEHRHSCCVLIAKTSYRRDGVWHTWIDYDRFHQLATSGNTAFTGFDYCAPTPSWAVYGSAEAGFSPFEKRVFSKGKQKRLLRDKDRSGPDADAPNGGN
ncbi:hypothetical protein NCLIV_035010 [Neospora caninum Liverpool]|uniref:tRNA 4-demethylwyosine synthase (AdoMet-dependent) n=1 Tax=Neospora caninum (strain Liverpool) TaxID=572307 RepID=F0VJ08_NEOCL|nr:hypothetical protein NCLIV_035010 [Neospora caninum Liverpool]CBZ53719.1 hypothetical protein NCLIV_035010 [Neospora caninum Liverpool]|eukprot:XP_003883751.1 hypothetical protein NCLIV_035010 [Neospora caninum Liverpool]